MTHTELSQYGLEQAQFLIEAGIAPEHIMISHMDRVIDIEKNAGLAELGVFLEYDTIARFKYHSNEDEVKLISEMVGRSFGRQILLGMDTTRERMQAYGGEIGLTYIKATFLPENRAQGIKWAVVSFTGVLGNSALEVFVGRF